MLYNYIAIEGNIGAGKTSLATMLSRDLNARLILEEFSENSFLPKFYEQPELYAFPLEVSFLVERFNQLQNSLAKSDLFKPLIIADYFFEKSVIFAQNNLQEDQYKLFFQLYQTFSRQIPQPDLLLFLTNHTENLQSNIFNRGREYELGITDEYLNNIQHSYFSYFRMKVQRCPVLIVDVTEADFVSDTDKYESIKALFQKPWTESIDFIKI